MKNKLICLISTAAALAALSVQAATLNEWNFYSDPAGKTLSQAYNSAGAAVFGSGNESALATDAAGSLLCTQEDTGTTGMWTNGAVLNAALPSPVSSGIQYLRYDFSYDLRDSNGLNDSGCVVGFSFYDSISNKVAGVALQYAVGITTNAPYQVTELAEMTAFTGTVAVIAKIDLDAKTLSAWYSLNGDVSGFSSDSPMHTVSNLTLSSFNSLGFQATGDIQPSNSTDQVAVMLLRTADTWTDAVAADQEVADPLKYANEWTFERDVNGRALSDAINSGTNSPPARFSAGPASVFTTNRALLCTGYDDGTNGVWTNGSILNAALPSADSGVHYLRYDVEYDLRSAGNNSGTLLGVYFTGDTGDKAAGVVMGCDKGGLTNSIPSGRSLTAVPGATGLIENGTLVAIAEADFNNNTLKVWYSLDGSNPTNYTGAAFTNALGLTSITNLRFHATGDFRPTGSDDYAAVDNIRHTIGATAGDAAWSEITQPAANLSAPPVLTLSVDSGDGTMEIGETNTVTVVISNSGGAAADVTSTLTHNGAVSAFTVISNNTPKPLGANASITNTYILTTTNAAGNYLFTVQAFAGTNSVVTTNFNMAVGAHLSFLPETVTEVYGGTYPELYEPGETLNITITTTNDGARDVAIVNTLSADPAYFTISPSSTNYTLAKGRIKSAVYSVLISEDAPTGNYTFSVTNREGSLIWTDQFNLPVFTRQPNSDWAKADNTTNLNLAGSWVNNLVPDATDRAVFTTNITAALTNDLGADLSWKGVSLISNTAPWTVTGSNTLTLGSSGIDMSQAQANLTIASKLALATTQTWNVVTSQTLAVSGNISGAGKGLIKTGEGQLVLTGTNTYSGGTVVSNGTLSVGGNSALGTGDVSVVNAVVGAAANAVLTNNIKLTGSTLFNNANSLRLNGKITGSGSLTKTGSSPLILAGTNTYSGGTTNSGTTTNGFIEVRESTSLGSGNVVMNDGSTLKFYTGATVAGRMLPNNFELNGSSTFNAGTGSADNTYLSGNIAGTGSLTLKGYQYFLYGNNTFSGGVTLDVSSYIYVYSSNGLGSGPITLNQASDTRFYADTEITNSISMSNNTFRILPYASSLILSGPMSGGGELRLADAGIGSSAAVTISGDNSERYGSNTWTYARLRLGHRNALGSGTVYGSGGYGLEVTTNLTGINSITNRFNLNTVVIDPNTGDPFPLIFNLDHDLELSGSFSSPYYEGQLAYKSGYGNLIFSGTALIDQLFEVQSGALTVNGSLSGQTITLSSGATLAGTGSVQAVTMESGSTLDLSGGGMTFVGDLTMNGTVLTKLSVNNASSALRGDGTHTLTADGTLKLDFSGNANATNGAVFAVFTNWVTRTDNGLQVFASGLPPFTTLNTSNLFFYGTVQIVQDNRLSAQTVNIIVPQGGTASGSVVLSNSTAGTLSFTNRNDGSWPADDYQLTSQQNGGLVDIPKYLSTNTVFTAWNGTDTAPMGIGFDLAVFGTRYSTFSVSQYGTITFASVSGETAVIRPFQSSVAVDKSTVRFVKENSRLVIAWGNGTAEAFQAVLNSTGIIEYRYAGTVSRPGTIGIQNENHSQTISFTPNGNILLLTPSSWITASPETGSIASGASRTLTFTANAANQNPGEYFFTATVRYSSGQPGEIGVFVTVTEESPQLDLPAAFTFYGQAGGVASTNMAVTNSGNAALNYTITDSGLQNAGYTVTDKNYDYTVTVPDAEGTRLFFSGGQSQNVNIGFPFLFFGNVYTTLVVNVNGTVTLGAEQIISPFSASLSQDGNTSIRYSRTSNRLVFIWENIAQSGAGSDQTFQAVMNRNGTVLFQYKQLGGTGWTNGTICLRDTANYVSTGTLSNEVTIIRVNGTNVVVNSVTEQALEFTPRQQRIISASPVSGTISAGGTTNILITGDARGLTNGATNSTTLTFSYSGKSTNTLVTFITTNSADADALAAGISGTDYFAAGVSQNADGSRLISWPAAADGTGDLPRRYVVYFTTNLLSGSWTELYSGYNVYSYVDTVHVNEPVIYYKVTVE